MMHKNNKNARWVNYRPGGNNSVFIFLLFIVAILTGCGGGGGGSDDPPQATYTVSGRILVEGNTAVDSDVNDPAARFAANDEFNAVQTLGENTQTIVLGGYVNISGTGAKGRFFDPEDPSVPGDRQDMFSAQLDQGTDIILRISESDVNLNLYLYTNDSQHILVDASEGTGDTETLTVSQDGDYIVEVRAVRGASNYTLTIGQAAITSQHADKPIGGDFVPGEAIVKFSQSPAATHKSMNAADSVRAMGFEIKSGGAGQSMLLRFKEPHQKAEVLRSLGLNASRAASTPAVTSDVPGVEEMDTLQIIRALNSRDDVEYAEPNYIVRPYAVPNDPLYTLQWHYPLIHLPEAWDVTQGRGDVVVAVIDTGVILDHPDLQGQLVDGYDFISDASSAGDGNGRDNNPDDPGDSDVGQSSFHGTHVSGTVAAWTNSGDGVAGAGWNVKVMPVRALGRAGGTVADLVEAIKYAAGLPNATGEFPARKADIINMSIGHYGFSQEEKAAIDLALDAGVIIVAAAGNEAIDSPSYPAAYDGVVSVSALNIQGDPASYSNFGSTIDVAAPGGDNGDLNNDGYVDMVLSTMGDDSGGSIERTYGFMAGTSMAAPHVAGVFALMKSLDLDMSPTELDAFLTGGTLTFDLGSAGKDNRYGYGMIDAQKAVAAVQLAPPTVLVANPSQGFLDEGENVIDLTLERLGSTQVLVNSVTADEAWMTVSPVNVDSEQLGLYRVTVDRNDPTFPEIVGIVTGHVTFASSANTVVVPINVKAMEPSQSADAGMHYVQIRDYDKITAGLDSLVAEVKVNVSSGSYDYRFTGIPAGRYLVFASTDMDNDLQLIDGGEAYGAYSSWQQPVVITVDRNMSGLDFTTGFKINLPAGQTMYSPLQEILEDDPDVMTRLE